MNEIEKMYENAGVEKKIMCEWTCRGSEICNTMCEHYESTKEFYPPFTSEKQLGLIKWLINKGQLRIIRFLYEYNFEFRDYDLHTSLYYVNKTLSSIEEGVYFIINNLWQDLTEEEKEQIRGILNG